MFDSIASRHGETLSLTFRFSILCFLTFGLILACALWPQHTPRTISCQAQRTVLLFFVMGAGPRFLFRGTGHPQGRLGAFDNIELAVMRSCLRPLKPLGEAQECVYARAGGAMVPGPSPSPRAAQPISLPYGRPSPAGTPGTSEHTAASWLCSYGPGFPSSMALAYRAFRATARRAPEALHGHHV